MIEAHPICKHITKAPQANATTKTLSKSLQSQPSAPRIKYYNFFISVRVA